MSTPEEIAPEDQPVTLLTVKSLRDLDWEAALSAHFGSACPLGIGSFEVEVASRSGRKHPLIVSIDDRHVRVYSAADNTQGAFLTCTLSEAIAYLKTPTRLRITVDYGPGGWDSKESRYQQLEEYDVTLETRPPEKAVLNLLMPSLHGILLKPGIWLPVRERSPRKSQTTEKETA